jgi:hypothetical protein
LCNLDQISQNTNEKFIFFKKYSCIRGLPFYFVQQSGLGYYKGRRKSNMKTGEKIALRFQKWRFGM